MSVAKYPEPDRAILKAFYVQYVSVLLILLSGMIGSLAGSIRATLPGEAPAKKSNQPRPSFAEIDLDKLFIPKSSELASPQLLDAVTQIGLDHDVDLEFAVPAGGIAAATGSIGGIDLASERAVAISRYVVDRGVPESAVRSWVHLDSDVSKLTVKLSFHRSAQ